MVCFSVTWQNMMLWHLLELLEQSSAECCAVDGWKWAHALQFRSGRKTTEVKNIKKAVSALFLEPSNLYGIFEEVTAVWMFWNRPTISVKIGESHSAYCSRHGKTGFSPNYIPTREIPVSSQTFRVFFKTHWHYIKKISNWAKNTKLEELQPYVLSRYSDPVCQKSLVLWTDTESV